MYLHIFSHNTLINMISMMEWMVRMGEGLLPTTWTKFFREK